MRIALDVEGERFGLDEIPLRDIVRWLDEIGAGNALNRILEHSEEGEVILGCSSGKLLSGRGRLPEMKPLSDLMVANYKVLEELYASSAEYHTFPWEREIFHTGMAVLDAMLGGIQKGTVTWLAGRADSGVSGLLFEAATGIAASTRADGKSPVGAIFSSTRAEEDVSMYMLAMRSGVKLATMRRGKWSARSWRQLAEASGALAESKLWILFDHQVTEDALRYRFDQFDKSGKRMDIIVLDRIELQCHLCPEALRILAEELNVAILVSSWVPARQLGCTPEYALRDAFPELFSVADTACFLEQNEGRRILHMVRPEVYPPVDLDEDALSGVAE